jgi:hypothetical protein
MSENPNPTRCGNCGTENPPGQEFCLTCHAPLTLPAAGAVLDETPEDLDDPRRYDAGGAEDTPEVVVMGGMGGAPIPVPGESLAPEPDQPPRD